MKLHYADPQPGSAGYGWATANAALQRELAKLVTLTRADEADAVFVPVANHDLGPCSTARARVTMGYTFFEYPLGPNAEKNAAQYDVLFAGSTWCMERLAERGIHNTALLIQGVDESIFSLRPPREPDGTFRIFSGGKFEHRKGQMDVISAFAEFAKTHEDAQLVGAWWNPWPALIPLGGLHAAATPEQQRELIFMHCCRMGIPFWRLTQLPPLPQREMARAMAETDCGLFPNLCEGGTNLVLMEYASLGRRVVANTLTGHADVADAIDIPIVARTDQKNGWACSTHAELIAALERAYAQRFNPVPPRPRWSWARAAEIIVEKARSLAKVLA